MKQIIYVIFSLFIMNMLTGCSLFFGSVPEIEKSVDSKANAQKQEVVKNDTKVEQYVQNETRALIPQFVINLNQVEFKSIPFCSNDNKYKDMFTSSMLKTTQAITEISNVTENGVSTQKNKYGEFKDGYELVLKQCVDKTNNNSLKTSLELDIYSINNVKTIDIPIQNVNHVSTTFDMNLNTMSKCEVAYAKEVLGNVKKIKAFDLMGNETTFKDGFNFELHTCITNNRNVIGYMSIETYMPLKQ